MGDDTTPGEQQQQQQQKFPLLQPIGSVEGKVVLVTGANRGIGKALVESFLDHGATKVYAACRSIESAESAFSKVLLASAFVVPLRLDLTDPQSIIEAASNATDVDIVINNAGAIARVMPLGGESTVDILKTLMDVNVYGFLRLANAFVPHLESNGNGGRGVLVQLNSVASMRCNVVESSAYCASKAAAFSMTQALRDELGPRGVHLVSVHPGPINTEMIADFPDLVKVAPDPSIVSECLIDAISSSPIPFLVYPDPLAKGLGQAYRSFAELVIEEGNSYGEQTDGQQ